MSLIQGGSDIKTMVMDHHGLVAAVCRDLGIIDKINARVGSKDPRRVIQPGLAVAAMIINGLGFTNRRLYLSPQFFERYAMNHEFTVTGMTCGHCEKAVTKAVQKQDPGAQVLIRRDQNLVQVQSTKEREGLRQAIVEEGYAVAS